MAAVLLAVHAGQMMRALDMHLAGILRRVFVVHVVGMVRMFVVYVVGMVWLFVIHVVGMVRMFLVHVVGIVRMLVVHLVRMVGLLAELTYPSVVVTLLLTH